MSVNFCFSSQLDHLLDELWKSIADNFPDDPFEPIEIFIPNRNLKKWLQIQLAHKSNIFIQYQFSYLENGLANMIKKIAVEEEIDLNEYTFLGHRENHLDLQLMIFSLFQGNDFVNEFEYLYRYLKIEWINGRKKIRTTEDDYIRRSWRLADRLTTYFREYEYQRKEMVERWAQDQLYYQQSSIDLIELAQKKIYYKIFIEKEFQKKIIDKLYITLPQYAEKVFKRSYDHLIYQKKKIYLFGFSQISKFHYDLLFQLERFYDISIYQLNFLNELFQSAQNSGQENISFNVKMIDSQPGQDSGNNEIIAAWGKISKDNTILLQELLQKKFLYLEKNIIIQRQREASVPDKQHNLLRKLQKKLIHHLSYEVDINTGQDSSLQVIGAPSIQKEVEWVYNSIIYRLLKDKNLKLTDIAVLFPDLGDYKTVIKSVFNKNKLIPYNLSDSNADVDSLFAKAVISGLKMAEGIFQRSDIFEFLLNPCFLAAHYLKREDVLMWLEWVDALNIFHSYDKKDKAQNSFSGNTNYTWQQGLKRLRLGKVMEKRDFDSTLNHFFGYVPFNDILLRDREKIDQFVVILEKVFNFLTNVKGKHFSGEKWISIIQNFISHFLAIPPGHTDEKVIKSILLKNIQKLKLVDQLSNRKKASFPLSFVIEFIKSNLINIPSHIGKYLTDGVTISLLAPMRPIPFKHIYILGLNEDRFPGYQDNSTLDLRNYQFEKGDITHPDRNRYLFLETLLSATEQLTLSFISQDIKKDEKKYPSPLIAKLIKYINQYILLNNPYEIAYLKADTINYEIFKKEGNFNYPELNFCADNDERLLTLLSLKKSGIVNEKIQKIEYKQNQPLLSPPHTTMPDNCSNIEQISLFRLYDFLYYPAQAKLKLFFNLNRDDEMDKSVIENEPFFSASSFERKLFQKMADFFIAQLLVENNSHNIKQLMDLFSQYYDYCHLQGQTPDGIFKTYDKYLLEQKLMNFLFPINRNGLGQILKKYQSYHYFSAISLGEGTEIDQGLVFSSLKLNNWSIKGKQAHIFINDKEFVYLIPIFIKEIEKRHLLPSFLFHCLLYCHPDAQAQFDIKTKNQVIIFYYSDNQREIVLDFSKIDPEQYLKDLIMDLVSPSSFDLLPLDLVDTLYPKIKQGINIDEEIFSELFEEKRQDQFRSIKEMDILELIKIELPSHINEKILNRFSFLFDHFK